HFEAVRVAISPELGPVLLDDRHGPDGMPGPGLSEASGANDATYGATDVTRVISGARNAPLTSRAQRRPELLRRSSHRRVPQLDSFLAGQRALRVPEPQLERQRALAVADLLTGVDVEERDVLQARTGTGAKRLLHRCRGHGFADHQRDIHQGRRV